MQAKLNTKQYIDAVNAVFHIGIKLKTGDYNAPEIGTLYKPAFEFEKGIVCCWVKYSEEDIRQVNIEDVRLAGVKTLIVEDDKGETWIEIDENNTIVDHESPLVLTGSKVSLKNTESVSVPLIGGAGRFYTITRVIEHVKSEEASYE